jgi:hypothetical protein
MEEEEARQYKTRQDKTRKRESKKLSDVPSVIHQALQAVTGGWENGDLP